MTLAKTPRFARALAPFFAATALVSIPAFAQDATQQEQPVVTPPRSATVAIPPVVRTVPDEAATAAAAPAEPAEAPAAPRSTASRSAASRSTAARTAARAAPARPAQAAPETAPAAAPVAQPEAATPAGPAAPPVAAASTPDATPAATARSADAGETRTTTTADGIPTWALVAGAISALAIIIGAIAALRRRRPQDEYVQPSYAEPTYAEPVAVRDNYIEPIATAPVAATPLAAQPRRDDQYLNSDPAPVAAVAAEDVEVRRPAAEEVAELTAGDAPVAERPWLEFAMRPVRAGTNVDEALVEIELTVGNSGSVPARDVRISTFLLSRDPGGSEMERLLVRPPADTTADPVTIQPGEGTRIDATLALLKSDMGDDLPASFRPIVVADARYTLADGSEGRTSASFAVGVTPEDGGALEPIELARASMHDNVAAELHGEPQHA